MSWMALARVVTPVKMVWYVITNRIIIRYSSVCYLT
jgi:hypothetical protein